MHSRESTDNWELEVFLFLNGHISVDQAYLEWPGLTLHDIAKMLATRHLKPMEPRSAGQRPTTNPETPPDPSP